MGELHDPWTERMLPHKSRDDDHRGPFDIDYARVVHSEAFRRLAGVTQILAISDSDFSRNRLTHTIEVGQVALGLVQTLAATHAKEQADLLPPRPLMETIAAIHDIGHPPGGHGGEEALCFLLCDHGGFEGNGQTLRILAHLMEGSTAQRGANLTRRTLLGALKYPVAWSEVADLSRYEAKISPLTGRALMSRAYAPPKCYLDTEQAVVNWMLAPLSHEERALVRGEGIKSLDCSLMDTADDISYGIHDLEDAVILRFIRREELEQDVPAELWDDFLAAMPPSKDLFESPREAWLSALFGNATKACIGRLVHYMITSARLQHDPRFETKLYAYRAKLTPPAERLLTALKRSVFNRMILAPTVQQMRAKTQRMIVEVYEALATDPPSLLPAAVRASWLEAETESERARAIGDYIASLTDAGLVKIWRRLFDANSGSAFDSLR